MMNADIDFKELFVTAPGRFMVLAPDDPKFTILAATDEYLAATLTKRDEIIGKGVFEVFPDNPADPATKAVDKARASFKRVIGLRAPDSMGVTEQDVRRPDGKFETRWWDATNFPIFGADGAVAGIMHRVEDVTRWELQRRKIAEQDSAVVALRDARRAAVNLMEDAIEARRQADEINEKLRQEILDHQAAEKEIVVLSRFPVENPNPVLRVGNDGALLFANSASAQILRCWNRAEVGDLLPPDIVTVISGVMASGKSRQVEIDCEGYVYDFVFAPVPEENYCNLYARDITERKKAEQKITELADLARQDKDRLSILINSIPDEIWFADTNRNFTLANPRAVREFGLVAGKETDVEGLARSLEVYRPDGSLRPVEEAPPLLALQGEVIKDQEEIIRIPGNGDLRYRQVSAAPVKDSDGKIVGSVSIVRDITEQRKAEEAIRQSEELYRAVVENTTAVILRINPAGVVTFANEQALSFYGYEAEELIGKPAVGTVVPPRETAGRDLAAMVDQIAADPDAFHINANENMRKDGSRVWLEWTNSGIYGSDGKLKEFLSVGIDATERRKAEGALKESEDKFFKAFNNSPNAITITRISDGKIIEGNESVYKLLGYTPDEVVGKTTSDLNIWANPEDRQRLVKGLVSKGFVQNEEYVLQKKDKTPIWVDLSASLITIGNDRCFLTSFIDITGRKKSETRVLKLTQIHNVLSRVNEAIVRTHDRTTLFGEVCHIITEEGHYPLAWIGEVGDGKIVPVSSSGTSLNYLHDIKVEVHGALGKGPTGTSIRENHSVINYNFEFNPTMGPWLAKAQKYGLASSAAFPLRLNENPMWALTVYAAEPDAFDPETTKLFESLSADVSYALDAMFEEESRIEAESSLQENERKYRDLFNNMIEEVHFWQLVRDQSGKIKTWRLVDANPQTLKTWGRYSIDEIRGKTTEEIFGPGATDHYMPIVLKVTAEGKPYSYVDYFPNLDKYFNFTTVPLGEYFITTGSDITPIKKAEEALRKNQETFVKLVEGAPFGMYIVDSGFRIAQMNQSAQTRAFQNVHPVIGRDFNEAMRILWPEATAVEIISRFRHTLETGEPFFSPRFTQIRNDVEVVESYEWELHRITFADGQFGVICYYFDSTELRDVEDNLRRSEERYRGLVEQTPDGIFVADSQGRYVDVNAVGAAMLGYTPQELLRLTLIDVLAPEELPRLPEQLAALATGEVVRNEWRFRRKDGTTFTGELTGRLLPDGRLQGLLRDTTVRKNAETALRESEEKYRGLFTSMVEGFALHEIILNETGKPEDYRFLEINPAFETITGLKAENIVGKTVKEVIPDIESSWIETYGKVALSGTPVTFENFSAPLGKWYQVQAYSPAHGTFATIFTDITERKKVEKFKDEFIGMISHELKTPITVVIGALSTATMPGLSEKVKADLFHDAVNHADILASIVDNLIELSRQQSNRLELRKKLTDVGGLACRVADQLKLKSPIHTLKCDFPEGLPKVPADPMRIERILYNLLENAIKYSPAGGEVQVSAKVEDGFLRIGVADQGIGISAENLPRLFQPFEKLGFEVKGAIQGTGLGLRVCRILTEAHGGRIWVESEVGRGSTFYFTLPLTNSK